MNIEIVPKPKEISFHSGELAISIRRGKNKLGVLASCQQALPMVWFDGFGWDTKRFHGVKKRISLSLEKSALGYADRRRFLDLTWRRAWLLV